MLWVHRDPHAQIFHVLSLLAFGHENAVLHSKTAPDNFVALEIWSFGVVLYEMLTGKQMFGGETVSDSLAGAFKTEIKLELLGMAHFRIPLQRPWPSRSRAP